MHREERFDSFYGSHRAALLHQCFALTGSLQAAQSAVHDAFVAAWHHWQKADANGRPEDWTRSRAWALAHRRHTIRARRRSGPVSAEQQATLDALARLSYPQRRLLLLADLALLPLQETAREAALPAETAAHRLQTVRSLFASHRGIAPGLVRPVLDDLGAVTTPVKLPRAWAVRRAGRRRRRSHTLLAALTAVGVAVLSGAIAYQPAPQSAAARPAVTASTPAASTSPEPTASPRRSIRLLDSDQIVRLGAHQQWNQVPQDAIVDVLDAHCRPQDFADPYRVAGRVRTFEAEGRPLRSAVQRLEVSRSTKAAQSAFETTVGWYSGCEMPRLQLLSSYEVDGTGDAATVLKLRIWNKPAVTYWVAVARVGDVTTSTVSSTLVGPPPPLGQVTQSLADSVAMICGSSGRAVAEAECSNQPEVTAAPPPSPASDRGLLRAVDLPPVGRVDQPWVGTTPAPTHNHNPAATTCDDADFGRAGAARARTRTFLIPEADLPTRFGMSETYGLFDSAARARHFMTTMLRRVRRCQVHHLSTKVRQGPPRPRASWAQASTWRLRTAVSAKRTVTFRLGFVRVGSAVAELTFSPVGRDDIPQRRFRALLLRAGECLRELGTASTKVGP